jgi:leucyl/phenylalanyl-tRNA--protein transferase
MKKKQVLPWLEPGESFPPATDAWGPGSDAPGLLAAGGDLSLDSLLRAYRHGIFPWFNEGQPILWWSTDPRMVLKTTDFRLHRSFKKVLTKFAAGSTCEVRFDSNFRGVIERCSQTPRDGQSGTWIVPEMVDAYTQLHAMGYAHSVETWIDDQLVGGLYCVAIGTAVFGESMFSHKTDASKIALASLIAFCRAHGIAAIDCQQNTRHLGSLGAKEMPRAAFLKLVETGTGQAAVEWRFRPLYWTHILSTPQTGRDRP